MLPAPSIHEATRDYEAWLGRHTRLVRADLEYKHEAMRSSSFHLLRATFYRWVQLWPRICPELAAAPQVLSVGDLHVENFGTWRDIEGRLVWGVNDFDEVWLMSYANDLVRLATSALLALREGRLRASARSVGEAILAGYLEGLEAGGRPFVLAERHPVLRVQAVRALNDPQRFWEGMAGLTPMARPPAGVRGPIRRSLPGKAGQVSWCSRRAGLGSLGHQRVVAVTDWAGGRVAREAKALVPSAAAWTEGRSQVDLAWVLPGRAVRCPDPMLAFDEGWVVRRLAPDCARVELEALPRRKDELRLLNAMGWETANVHLGSPGAVAAVRRDLQSRPDGWLRDAARRMARATRTDHRAWLAG